MKKLLVAAAVVVAAGWVGTLWLRRDIPREPGPAAVSAGSRDLSGAATPARSAPPATLRGSAASRPVSTDPRLAALIASPDGALVEFLLDADGRLIKEMDADPASPGYRRSLREYTYAGDRLIRLVRHVYMSGETRSITADVVYGADGRIDQYHETTKHETGR